MIHYGDMMLLCIEETNMMGHGVAKIDNMVIFCENAAEGDTVIAFINEVKKNYGKATALKIVSPSPHRSDILCPHFKECGGCSFTHVSYEHEAEVKRKGISDAFRRCGGIKKEADRIITGKAEGYRNKAVFHFDENKSCCFFKGSSRELLRIDSCRICNPQIIKIKNEAEKLLKANDGINAQELTYLYIRYMERTDEASVVLGYRGSVSLSDFAKELTDTLPCIKCVMRGVEEAPEARKEQLSLIWGSDRISDDFCDMKIDVSPRSFYQVNHENAEKLCRLASEFAELKEGDVCLDLYCGTGTIGLTVAKLSPKARVYGVEINAEAIENAKSNAAANGISNIEFFCGDSKDFAEETKLSRVDCIIVDPPRAGLSKKAVSEILRFAPEKLVYISCSPDTLARDLKALTTAYEIKKAVGVDLFPKTAHVETVVLLSKSK